MSDGAPLDAARVARLSDGPGVYMFRSARGEVLYVGKAKSLRARVRSYLGRIPERDLKTRELMRRVRSVDALVVGTEAEALILEANLIKERQPRFNILLRDDKRYPFVKVTVGEPFPRALVTRRAVDDGARYFGPFVSVGRVRRALELLVRAEGLRSCRYDLPDDAPARPCLDHQIGRCAAPCVGLQSQEDYRAAADRVVAVLAGDVAATQAEALEEMRAAAEALDYERAARMRDVVAGLDAIAARQRVEKVGAGDLDLIGVARDGAAAAAVAMHVRAGALVGRRAHAMTGVERESDEDLLARSVTHAYLSSGAAGVRDLPREVLLPGDFPDRALLEGILSDRAGRDVKLRAPKRGAKARLLELAAANARHALGERIRKGDDSWSRVDDALSELRDELGLKVVPRRMVCFDVSHSHGAEVVASAVAFENGKPLRSGYRHMRIRGGWGADDYRSLAEAVERRFRRLAESGDALPDLAIVDGGKGQLGAAAKALARAGVGDVPLLALAKREEVVHMAGRAEGLRLPRTARSLHLLQWIRDEAHRFALRYNRKLRSRRAVRSALADVPGVGPKRQRDLLIRFGSLKGVEEASAEEIGRLPGFSEAMGVRILTYLERASGRRVRARRGARSDVP